MDKNRARFVELALQRFISGKYSASKAATITGYKRSYIYFLAKRYKRMGFKSLIHKSTNRPPANKTNAKTESKIIDLYQTKYEGFNFTHFKEMLFENEHILISYCALYRILTDGGFSSPKHQKIKHKENIHPIRPRRRFFGELVQIDGSIHLWFGRTKYTLHAAIDDATSQVVGAYFDKEETLFGYYSMFKQILENYGIPQEFYSGRRTIFEFKHLNEDQKSIEKDTFTQFTRCCNQLGVEIHTTSVSQAKGRIERLFNTFQDRLISEMRLADVQTVEEANLFLTNYVKKHNVKFALPIDYNLSLFAPSPSERDINLYLSVEYERVIDNGSTFSFKNQRLQIVDENGVIIGLPPKTKIKVYETFDKQLLVLYKNDVFSVIKSTFVKEEHEKMPRKIYIPPANHPWRRLLFRKLK